MDSDYGFLVVTDTDTKPSRRGLIARTPEEWERGFPLKKEIVSEGKIVFERGDQSMAHEGVTIWLQPTYCLMRA